MIFILTNSVLVFFIQISKDIQVRGYVKVYIFELRRMIWRYDWSSELCTQLSEAVVKLKLYTENKEWGPNQTRMFLGFNFTTALSCEYKGDDQSYLHHSPQFKYMKLLVFFTFYGYITNLQSGRLPVGLIAQLVEHRCCRGHRFESRSGLIFLQTLIPQLLKLCA